MVAREASRQPDEYVSAAAAWVDILKWGYGWG